MLSFVIESWFLIEWNHGNEAGRIFKVLSVVWGATVLITRLGSVVAAAPDQVSGCLSLTVPRVQVTDENGKHGHQSSSPSDISSCLSHRMQSVSISSYTEMSRSDEETPHHDLQAPLFFRLGDDMTEVEEGEEAEGMEGEGLVVLPPDSSFIFQDISIPSTMTCQEFRSNTQFTVYHIEVSGLACATD